MIFDKSWKKIFLGLISSLFLSNDLALWLFVSCLYFHKTLALNVLSFLSFIDIDIHISKSNKKIKYEWSKYDQYHQQKIPMKQQNCFLFQSLVGVTHHLRRKALKLEGFSWTRRTIWDREIKDILKKKLTQRTKPLK